MIVQTSTIEPLLMVTGRQHEQMEATTTNAYVLGLGIVGNYFGATRKIRSLFPC